MNKLINWLKAHKVITAIIVLLIIIIAVNGSSNQKPQPASSPKPAKTTSTSQPQVSYQKVEDKGTYAAVLIPASYVNKTQMPALGQKLKSDFTNKSFIRVYVFDDATAASYLDTELQGQSTDAQNAVYDPHFVGIYQKNSSTNLNRFVITYDGDQGSNSQTINY